MYVPGCFIFLPSRIVEREDLHDVRAAGQASPRQSAGQNLGERAQIGLDVAKGLKSPRCDAKARDDFIQDEEHVLLAGQLPEAPQKLRPGRHNTPVRSVSFVDHARGLVLVDRAGDGRQVVRPDEHQIARDCVGHAGRDVLGRVVGRLGRGNQRVVPAVEVTDELHDLVPAGRDPRNAKRHQGRFRAAVGKADLLGSGDELLDPLAPFDLKLVAGPGMRGQSRLTPHGLDHGRMAVPQEERPVPDPVIDDLVSIDVPFPRAGGPVDINRKRLEIASVMRDAAGEDLCARSYSRREAGNRSQNAESIRRETT